MSNNADLEEALGKVKKEIQASRNQPEAPETTTTKEKTMATNAAKKTTKKTEKTSKDQANAAPVDGYTASQLAEELGIDSVTLRKGLRAVEAKKPGGRWVWPKKTDADLAEIRKQLKDWLAEPKAKKDAAPAKEKKGNGKSAPAKKTAKKDAAPAAKKAPAKKAAKKVAKKAEAASE